ncbi:type 3 dihydrofolate reductase [Oceanisphaera avium]|uniref:Dihydrofolate reductase n=1 Tax=Oceanisphaera avium TaxID=1903694 RepID=A0A1Y0CX82_9GAMM|nr:type 3 dihydrofolate reductase [Oceanisphaera avium]ART79940.1 dihydrofolate reductase [Oceanisphaera avium]
MIVAMIVAMTRNGVIGKDNAMPWHLPADLAYFKQTTLGKPIVMGRNTFNSIGRALPGRRNIIVSQSLTDAPTGTEVVSSPAAALALVKDEAEVMVMGGGQLYQAFLSLSQRLYLTLIEADVQGDTYFPFHAADWQLECEELRLADERNEYNCRFQVYKRV